MVTAEFADAVPALAAALDEWQERMAGEEAHYVWEPLVPWALGDAQMGDVFSLEQAALRDLSTVSGYAMPKSLAELASAVERRRGVQRQLGDQLITELIEEMIKPDGTRSGDRVDRLSWHAALAYRVARRLDELSVLIAPLCSTSRLDA